MKAFEWIRDEGKSEKVEIIAGAALLAAALAADKLLGLTGWGRTALYLAAYIVSAARVLLEAAGDIRKGDIFGEGTLMCVSTVGALALGEYPEAVAVMLFFRLGEAFEELAEDKSRRSISHLLELKSDTARVRRGGDWAEEDVAAVRAGDIVLVPPGGRFPLDGVVEEGSGRIDTSALTGESMPREVSEGDEVLQGCVNGGSAIVIRVTKEDGESTASRILRMVEEAQEGKASREKFITRFSEKYTPAVVALAVLLAVVPLFFGGEFSVWVRRALVFLVISCPCALVISVPLTFFGGIGAASRKGLLVRSGEALERLAYVKSAVFDKTGTLTRGEFAVREIRCAQGITEEELLSCAKEAESFSTHPIAESIRRAAGDGTMGEKAQDDREYPGMGVSVTRGGHVYAAGNAGMLRQMGYDAPMREDEGATAVYVLRDGKYIGYLTVADEVRGDTKAALSSLRDVGIDRLAMLTGDAEGPAAMTARECGISDYRSRQLPADKAEVVKGMEKAMFTGDGINDAPALAAAYVGIAMGGIGSDAAIEAADAVVMNASLTSLPGAVRTARRTMRIVTENIAFSLSVKLVLMVLGVFGIAGMWLAVAGDVGVMILAVLNSMRMMRDR